MSTEKHFECCGIRLLDFKINIISLYRTPDSNIEIFIKKLDDLLTAITAPGYRNFICGDFNINTEDNCGKAQRLEEILLCFDYRLLIDEPTRITANTQKTIDNIICNCTNITSSGSINTALSDHKAVFVELTLESNKHHSDTYTKRIINDESYEYFRYLLSRESWEEVRLSRDADTAYDNFIESYLHLYNIAFPVKSIKKSKRGKTNKSWISDEVIRNSETKRFFYELKMKYPDSDEIKQLYDQFSSRTKLSASKAKKNFNISRISHSSNKMKEMWKIIKPKQQTKTSIHLKLDDGTLEMSPNAVANRFNKFFVNIAENLNLSPPIISDVYEVHDDFHLKPMESDEMLDIIQSLESKESHGVDGISNRLLKRTADLIVLPVTHIVNLSFTTGIFPNGLKSTIIKPIHKSGSKKEIYNYRPIALIPCISKILEKAMCIRLTEFLNAQNIIASQQNGFQRNKSTSLAIFQGLIDILDSLENDHFVAGIFCDLSKAFDCVSHDLLLHKMKNYGISGITNSWFKSYLSNRTQCVQIDGTRSDWLLVKRGVPQGSVLGPLLFLLYINDFPEKINYNSVLFADDATVLYKTKNNEADRNNEIKILLEEINNYFTANSLALNIEKTQALVPRHRNIVDIGKSPFIINTAQSVKFLGMVLNTSLDWSTHIDQMLKKLSSLTFLIKRMVSTCSQECAKTTYYAYFESVIRYGIIFWGSSSRANEVLRLQKRCIRNIFSTGYRESCQPIFKEQRILTVPSLFILETALFVKQHYSYFQNNTVTHEYNTRNKTEFYIPNYGLATSRKGVFNLCMRVYNNIPNELKELSLNVFKRELKDLLIKNTRDGISSDLNKKNQKNRFF